MRIAPAVVGIYGSLELRNKNVPATFMSLKEGAMNCRRGVTPSA